MTRREYFEMLRRNSLGDEYGNTMPNRPLPILEEREFVPEEYERFMPYPGRDGRRLRFPGDRIPSAMPYPGRDGRRLRFPGDRIPSAMPEEGLDYGRPSRSLRQHSYPEYEYRYGRDDVKPHRLDDGGVSEAMADQAVPEEEF